jgi:hypothetical protein
MNASEKEKLISTLERWLSIKIEGYLLLISLETNY